MVDIARLRIALPELSEEKRNRLYNFIRHDLGVIVDGQFWNVTQDDLMRSGILTSDQAAGLMKYWRSHYAPPENWDNYGRTHTLAGADCILL